jgi:putative phosphoesterase
VTERSALRLAVVSDIHGNRTAFEAVLADLRDAAPDRVLHGGDLADGGSSPVAVLDQVRELGWPGVLGNTDEMLFRPAALDAFAGRSKAPPALWNAVREIAAATRATLGAERLEWLSHLEACIVLGNVTLLHAAPASCWQAPAIDAGEEELRATYSLGSAIVVYGHTHVPGVRRLAGSLPRLVINTGSVGLPYDGDPRASYLLLDGEHAEIRRVAYDVERELALLAGCGLPGAAWTAKMLRARGPTLP